MPCFVRLLITSDRVIPYSEISNQGKWIRLISGMDTQWERIEIYEPENTLICILERHPVSPDSKARSELEKIKEQIRDSYPVNAREWIRQYFSKVKTLYIFQLTQSEISKEGWRVLGRIQCLLHDLLIGIIQADDEGFYNENGDLILWQMYSGATGRIPAATLGEDGTWTRYLLNLNDVKSVEQFKQGILPKKGFLGRLLSR